MTEALRKGPPLQSADETTGTALTRYVKTNGILFAYRRFGREQGVPLILNPHFLGTMDSRSRPTLRSSNTPNYLPNTRASSSATELKSK